MGTPQKEGCPIKKLHYVGTSAVVTIDQTHVKRLNLNEFTFFVQIPMPNGILLEKRILTIEKDHNLKQMHMSETAEK